MKKYIYSILVLVLFAFVGCVNTEELDSDPVRNGDVRLSIRTTSGLVARATIEDTSLEERIDWVDVFVFNADAEKTIFHKERIDVSAAPVYKSGEFPLLKKRAEFGENTPYYVYLVANAKANLSSAEAGVECWADLQELVQEDTDLHFSAFVDAEGKPAFAGAPARFLMDGFAFLGNPNNPSAKGPEQMGTCVINDPNADDILLCGTLYRAAAKFIINIKPGSNVEFKKELLDADRIAQTPQYYINQLPVSTRVLPQQATDYYNVATQNTATTGLNPYTFVWNDNNSMTIVGYGYSDDWSKLEYTKQTSMVFNLPMLWDEDKDAANGKEASTADNWYTIPLSKEKRFERNTCYVINITVNAVGAEEREYAIELKDIEYKALPWEEVSMDLGGYGAAFLTLNTDLVKIYDTNIDKDQLTFTSSSPIVSIVLKDTFSHNEKDQIIEQGGAVIGADGLPTGEYTGTDGLYAYYIDKFGQKIQLGTDPGFDLKVVEQPEWTKEQILAKETNLYKKEGVADNEQYIRAEVWDEHKRALNGNITIHSPILPVADNEDLNWPSHFNTVRYLEFEVTNLQGIKAIFRVEQTPVTVISNKEGFFSYRSDFHIGDDEYVYHNPADWYTPSTYPSKIEDTYGKTNPPTAKTPAHFLNPSIPMFSFSGFQAYHEDPVEADGRFVKGKVNCGNGSYEFDEALYGNMPRNYYRTFEGNTAGTFHRGHYYYNDGTHFNASSMWKSNNTASNASAYYQAVGRTFEKTVDGVTKYYRRHYTGNLFETFQSKVVREVYTDNDESRTMPILEEVWYCPNCTVDKSVNPEGGLNYVKSSDCVNPAAHKKNFYNGYYDTGKVKKIVKGMGAIYKIMAGGQGEDWIDFTALNPLILLPLTSKNSTTWTINRTQVQGAILHNHRMYHVRVTSTSNEYVIANPQMMDENGNLTDDRSHGFTMEGDINARIVSPSFMIASELGETIIPQNEAHYVMPGITTIYDLARKQCREYVETYYVDDDKSGGYTPGDRVYHYDDWRLPTQAEIEYIVKHQESSRAMDKVLSAQHYFHASTVPGVYTDETLLSDEIPGFNEATKGWYMRCVRDAYIEPNPVRY